MSTDNDVIEKPKSKLKQPTKWAVVLHNDDFTPMDFVVELLCRVFKMSIDKSADLMFTIHTEGKGIAGVFSHEIAEQKLAETHKMIAVFKQNLVVTIEEE